MNWRKEVSEKVEEIRGRGDDRGEFEVDIPGFPLPTRIQLTHAVNLFPFCGAPSGTLKLGGGFGGIFGRKVIFEYNKHGWNSPFLEAKGSGEIGVKVASAYYSIDFNLLSPRG